MLEMQLSITVNIIIRVKISLLNCQHPINLSWPKMDFYADMIIENSFSTGQFKVTGDTICLNDALNSRTFTLIRKSEEILMALLVD